MTETDAVDGYAISWHVYIPRLYFCVENKTHIKPFYNIYILETFISCAKGTYKMLLNGNRAVSVPCYRKDVAILVPRYVETVF